MRFRTTSTPRRFKRITHGSGRLVKEFFQNTSLHGLKFAAEEQSHWFERLLWLFIFLGGVCFSGYFCWEMWHKWEESPVIQSLDSHLYNFESDSSFPAVTICNVNKVSKQRLFTLMENNTFSGVSYQTMQSTLRYLIKLDRGIGSEKALIELKEFYASLNISTTHLFKILRQSTPTCSDIIIDCNWAGLTENCMSYFALLPTDDGICCTFNGASYNDSDLGIYSPKRDPLIATGKGYLNGLSLVLNANLDDYSVTNGKFDGFKVLVHSPQTFPDVFDRGFVSGPGFETFVGVKRISTITTNEAKNQVSPDRRGCYTDEEGDLTFFPKYSQSACFVECTARRMESVCKCRPYFYPAYSNVPLCDLPAISCLSSVYKEMEKNSEKFCNCLPSCSDIWYEPEISYAPFPGRGFNLTRTFQRLVRALNVSKGTDTNSYFRSNVAVLHVYYKEQSGLRYKLDIRYSVADFVSAVGGLLGLGLGLSFVSLVEIIYFCCFRHYILCHRSKKTKNTLNNDPEKILTISYRNCDPSNLYFNDSLQYAANATNSSHRVAY